MIIHEGSRFGHLTVIQKGEDRRYGKAQNLFHTSICRCDCGNIITTLDYSLLRGYRVKCSPQCSCTFKGRYISSHGYVCVYCPNHPSADKRGYVYEHRLVMEQHIGRYLLSTEDVHHKDKNRQNNHFDNLLLLDRREHHRLHRSEQISRVINKSPQCPICGGHTSKEGCICRTCYDMKNRKTILPTKEALQTLLDANTLTSVSIQLGISRTTLRKKIKRLGLTYDSRSGRRKI